MRYGIEKSKFNFNSMGVISNSGPWLLYASHNAALAVCIRLSRPGLRMFRALAAICWCLFPLAGAHAHPGATVSTISVITLEKRCMGCPDEQVLRLQRDGTVHLTRPGNARLGQQDQQLLGHLPRRDFEALARRLAAAGFFTMAEIYEDPQMRDGSTSTISVERPKGIHAVTSREGLGPPNLLAVLAELELLQKRIAFKAVP